MKTFVHPREHLLSDAAIATACAAVLSGIPSTLYACWTGADVLQATRAAGTVLLAPTSGDSSLIAAAAVVHSTVSIFWGLTLTQLLPRKRTTAWAMLAAAAIAVLDLRVIGRLFPEIMALEFWPQFADHLAFGGVLGAVLEWRFGKRKRRGG